MSISLNFGVGVGTVWISTTQSATELPDPDDVTTSRLISCGTIVSLTVIFAEVKVEVGSSTRVNNLSESCFWICICESAGSDAQIFSLPSLLVARGRSRQQCRGSSTRNGVHRPL
jgi:hypothetical protein